MRRRQTIETARTGVRSHGARGRRGEGQGAMEGVGSYLRLTPPHARPTSLDARPARSSALINKLTVKYLRAIREAATILLSLCLVIDPVEVINVFCSD